MNNYNYIYEEVMFTYAQLHEMGAMVWEYGLGDIIGTPGFIITLMWLIGGFIIRLGWVKRHNIALALTTDSKKPLSGFYSWTFVSILGQILVLFAVQLIFLSGINTFMVYKQAILEVPISLGVLNGVINILGLIAIGNAATYRHFVNTYNLRADAKALLNKCVWIEIISAVVLLAYRYYECRALYNNVKIIGVIILGGYDGGF